jgi:hypothetical protein
MEHIDSGIDDKADQGCKKTKTNEGEALSGYSNESTIIGLVGKGSVRTYLVKSDAKASINSAQAPQMLGATV